MIKRKKRLINRKDKFIKKATGIKRIKIKKNKSKKGNKYKKYYRNIIISKLIILILFIIYIFIYKTNLSLFLGNDNKKIIENNNYESFTKMKLRYINNTLFKPYLETINIISHVYNENIMKLKKRKTNIHITVSLNNRYIYPQLVSIESVLINCNKHKTFLTYHILCAPDVTENNLSILKSLVNKYPLNLEIIFYNMNNNFKKFDNWRISQATAYRLATPIILDINRLIHLDGDTLTLKDLTKMYKMDMKDNYIFGTLDVLSDGIDKFGIKSEKFINAGVVLLNLEKIRNDNKTIDLFEFINSRTGISDQTVFNYIFYPKIGILPYEIGTWNFYDESDIRQYTTFLRTKINVTEVTEGFKNPTIIHSVLCWPKIWSVKTIYATTYTYCKQRGDCSCEKYHNLWHSYANKTDYYEEIQHYTGKK